MPIPRLVAAGLLGLTLASATSAADDDAHARATLVSETATVVAGQPFLVAISFEIDPKWHLYWKDPGDSGLPPSVKWTLPEGFRAGELQFPTPKVHHTPAGTNYIYEDRVALLVTITPPEKLKDGEKFELVANLKWLECTEEICVPAKQSATTGVVVGAEVSPQHTTQFLAWKTAVKEGESFTPPAKK